MYAKIIRIVENGKKESLTPVFRGNKCIQKAIYYLTQKDPKYPSSRHIFRETDIFIYTGETLYNLRYSPITNVYRKN